MPVFLPYFLVFTFFLVIYLISLPYLKQSNQLIKFLFALIISSISSVLLTNVSLIIISDTIEAGIGGGNQSSYYLPCGRADIKATNISKDSNGLVDISIELNGRKAFATNSTLNYDGFSALKLADVRYSFADFDWFVDVVVSTPSKQLVINGSSGEITANQ